MGEMPTRQPDGLPRTRGDQPRANDHRAARALSPPHPRGSTLFGQVLDHAIGVSPAPAGINPPLTHHIPEWNSLPRTRGDQPGQNVAADQPGGSPPHPRGSTPHPVDFWTKLPVSPAPAGINPEGAAGMTKPHRLPRTRGDQPGFDHAANRCAGSPPHPRGSTRCRPCYPSQGWVSPAPAGINPSTSAATASWVCLPRTRGDQPADRRGGCAGHQSPPHPRGSTRCDVDPRGPRSVSPAPAGINPAFLVRRIAPPCLPRTRGDQPLLTGHRTTIVTSPPHPRGSTPLQG